MMMQAPILSLILMVLGSSFFMSFTSLFLKSQNFGGFEVGLVQSSFYFGLLISSLRSEKFIGRIGHIRALTATCGLMTASTLGLFIIPLQHWFWLRFINGACVGCFYVGVESWLLAEVSAKERGKALAVYTVSLYFAQSLSQLFLGWVKMEMSGALAISALFTSLAVVPVSIGRSKGPEPEVADPGSIWKFLKLAPLGVLGCFLAGMMLSTLYAFMPLYLEDKGFDPGHLMTLMILGGALLQWPIGKLSDHMNRRKVLTGLAIMGTLSMLILLQLESLPVFSVVLFLVGGLFFTVYPVAMALGCDCVGTKDIVKMTGVLLFAYGVGAVLGPSVAPLFRLFGPNYMISMEIFCGLALLATGLYAQAARKPIAPEDQSDFTMIPVGPIVDTLHPATAMVAAEEDALSDSSNGAPDDERDREDIIPL